MKWITAVAVLLVFLNGAWMAFDGSRALLVGDYVTPKEGRYAGQLGPWAGLLSRLGVDPRSTPVKAAFVIYGLAVMAVSMAFLLHAAWARTALLVLGALGLWYLPFGTLVNLALLVVLIVPSMRR
jgi:hypothetical protein